MSVSTAVRMALAKGNKKQVELAKLFGSQRQVISLKLARESWTGAELARVAAFTGGKLAIVYPDGQQIEIAAEAPARAKKKAAAKKAQQEKPPQVLQEAPKPAAKKAKTPGKPKASVKKPMEEQISMFD